MEYLLELSSVHSKECVGHVLVYMMRQALIDVPNISAGCNNYGLVTLLKYFSLYVH